MHIRFWGTRGSLAKAGPTTLRYGGSTSCVEVGMADGTLIVFDCGTGAHGLGQALLASGKRPIDGDLFLTHTHWGHIPRCPVFRAALYTGQYLKYLCAGSIGEPSGGAPGYGPNACG